MKKIALLASIFAATFVLASCATKNTTDASTMSSSQTTATHHHHHDYKGETAQ